jgi:hypothetical protein
MQVRLTLVAESVVREMQKDKALIQHIFPGQETVSAPDIVSAIVAQFGKKWKERKRERN